MYRHMEKHNYESAAEAIQAVRDKYRPGYHGFKRGFDLVLAGFDRVFPGFTVSCTPSSGTVRCWSSRRLRNVTWLQRENCSSDPALGLG